MFSPIKFATGQVGKKEFKAPVYNLPALPTQNYTGERLNKDIKTFPFCYGTAWKQLGTRQHVLNAIRKGFRAFDSASQPKHYYQRGVGEGIAMAIKLGIIASRDELWLQSKYTSPDGQDPTNMPYFLTDPMPVQVKDSFDMALKDYGTDYLDAFIMHGPEATVEKTIAVWNEMEKFVDAGQCQVLGISNCYYPNFFREFYDKVRIKPTILQNRFYQDTKYDAELRHFCRQAGITYQSFWTLTANPHLLNNPAIDRLMRKYNSTTEAIIYKYLMQKGVQPLNGTTNVLHMEQDLELTKKPLDEVDVKIIDYLIGDEYPL